MPSIFDIKECMCWNEACSDYGKKGNGNIVIKERKGKNQRALLKCKTCNKCFCESHGTPFFGIKTPIPEIARAITLIPHLGSIRAVARETNHKPDTILSWIALAENNGKAINDYLHYHLHYSQAQIDDIWTSIHRRKRTKNLLKTK